MNKFRAIPPWLEGIYLRLCIIKPHSHRESRGRAGVYCGISWGKGDTQLFGKAVRAHWGFSQLTHCVSLQVHRVGNVESICVGRRSLPGNLSYSGMDVGDRTDRDQKHMYLYPHRFPNPCLYCMIIHTHTRVFQCSRQKSICSLDLPALRQYHN